MAPRKRQKLMRIDAALDAMRPLGFPDTLVRTTVRHLLKEYGGNESWPFIEDSAYKVLIDTLLDLPNEEEEEEEEEEEQAQGDCNGEERQCNKHTVGVGHNDVAGELVPNGDIGDERERADQQLELYDQDVVDEDVCQEDGVDNGNHPSSSEYENLSTGLEGHVHRASSCTPPPVDCATVIQTRAPCFGWISDDD